MMLKQDPYIIQTYLKLGLIYYEKGQYNKAMQTYEDALSKDPNIAEVLNQLGIVYFKKGFYNKARQQWEKALEIEPDFLPARRNLEAFKKNVK
ncbi:MAG: tetratricopeptide repeat protein [Candidatus Omnitrophica bacterium]|nr:tetratricopeptide repeat protein [Candidatus Omnitrophota bacterium]